MVTITGSYNLPILSPSPLAIAIITLLLYHIGILTNRRDTCAEQVLLSQPMHLNEDAFQ